MIDNPFQICYNLLFPGKLLGDSRQGHSTLTEYEEVVSKSEVELSNACNNAYDLSQSIRNDVMATFSLIDNLVEVFLNNVNELMLFESIADANELIMIVALDMKKAVLDYALQFILKHNNYKEKIGSSKKRSRVDGEEGEEEEEGGEGEEDDEEEEEEVFTTSHCSGNPSRSSSSFSSSSSSHQTKKRRPNLPSHAKSILSEWFQCHVDHPYPSQNEKQDLSLRTGLSIQKVDNWFINERSRKWSSYRRK